MGKIFTNREGTIRLYDSTATPYYLEMQFDNGDLDGPIGAPLTEEILILHRGRAGTGMHYVEGDDFALMAPVDVTFTARLSDTATDKSRYLIDWLVAMNGTGTVNSKTLETTKGDTQRDGATNNPAFAESTKKTCNIEFLLDGAGTDLCFKYAEVWLPLSEQKITESADAVTVSITGHCYGTITRPSVFTTGTDVTV